MGAGVNPENFDFTIDVLSKPLHAWVADIFIGLIIRDTNLENKLPTHVD